MDSGNELLLRGPVYGADPDNLHPGPPGQRYAELVGGPLDGLLLDITGWTQDESTPAPLPRQSSRSPRRPGAARPAPG